MSAKAELQMQRQKLIEQLKTAETPQQTASIQADLSIVNAEIKKLNITEAAENTRNAAVKKALGQAEFNANEQRATDRADLKKPNKAAPRPPNMTLAEWLLHRSKQLLRTFDNMKRKMSHTIALEEPLREFVKVQEQVVAEEKAARKVVDEQEAHDWEQTWAE